ncbi:MAG: 1-acyl-sn-glycerol-3-phosphate acyltransferase [Spirochaetaceae bacterium]|nr:1-acyl-sn-glycerol-3-phosphate acyltransferase [Spirochaetaceae bacterium]
MEKREQINNENTFVPKTNFVYPEEPNTPFLQPKIKHEIKIDSDYPFLSKKLKDRLWNGFVYFVIFTLVFPLQKIRYGLKIKGRKNFTKNRKHFKNGGMTVSNHVYRWDFLACLQAVKFRRMWFPARALQLSGSDANLIKGAGGIPIPDSIAAMRGFNEAFDTLHAKKKWIHVFPEGFRWDFYQPIRPFLKGAFTMAVKYNIPVLPIAISYREPTGIYKLLKVKHPLITVSVGTPIFPSEELSKKENIFKLREEAHKQIVEMAGIKQNMWPFDAD